MKKVYRTLFLGLGTALVFGLGIAAAACTNGGKTNGKETASLTLQAGNGGTLEKTDYEVEVGTVLSEYLKNISPAAEDGLTFSGWYNGNAVIENGATMPASGLTLTAKYNAQYTVKLYREGENGYGDATESSGVAIYGEPFVYSPDFAHDETLAHFELDDAHEGTLLSTQALGKHDVFSVYLAIAHYTVGYDSNAPDGEAVTGFVDPVTLKYGETTAVAGGGDYTAPPYYRFAGWATEEDGELVYREGDEIAPEKNMILYAVWDEGYRDRFGGGDFIFTPSGEEGVAVLSRVGVEYRGEYEDGAFSFSDPDENEVLKGKLNPNGTFVYYREGLKNVTYLHADAYRETLHEDGAAIVFDGYDGATYTEGGVSQHGTVSYDPETMVYTFVDDDGEAPFEFLLTDLVTGGTTQNVFMRQGAEYGVRVGYKFHYVGGQVRATQDSVLYLDGFGIAAFLDPASTADNIVLLQVGTYLPRSEGEVDLSLYDEEDEFYEYRAKLLEYGGTPIWLEYDAALQSEFIAKDGAKLVLDGYSGTYESATYTPADGAEKKGMYVVEISPLGQTVRLVAQDGAVTTLRIDPETKELSYLGDGEYYEYLRYLGDAGRTPVDAPVLVFSGKDGATIYGVETTTVGTVSAVQGKTDRYLFHSDSMDFEYELGEGYFAVMEEVRYFRYFKMYPVESKSTFTLTGPNGTKIVAYYDASSKQGNAVYTDAAGNERVGVYTIMTGAAYGLNYDVAEFMDISTSDWLWFAWERGTSGSEYKTFTPLSEESDIYYLYTGTAIDSDVSLLLIGNGTQKVALYHDSETGDRFLGTYTYDEKTGEGTMTASADADGKSFDFLLIEAQGALCFVRHTDLFEGTLEATSGEHKLMLDGYGFAVYDGMDADYYLVGGFEEEGKENVYRFYVYGEEAGQMFESYFDVDVKTKKYTVCGYEVGMYYADDTSGDVLYLDGYSNVTRFNISEYEGEDLKPLGKGTYTFTDKEEEILLVTFGTRSYHIHIWKMGGGEGHNYFTVEYTSAGTYRSALWEILTLAEYGDAVYTDAYGITYQGTYTAPSAHVVCFASDSFDEELFFVLNGGKFTRKTTGFIIDEGILVKYLGGEGENITIPAGVSTIAPLAFSVHEYGSRYRGADIVTLNLGGVETVGSNAFNGCTLLTSVVGNKVTRIDSQAFYGCIELAQITFPLLEEIGEMAFRLCESLTEVSLAQARTIYSSAFSACTSLVTVSLPAAEELYEGVFYDCYALASVTLGASLTQLGTPDNPVAGVFGRDATTEPQAELALVLKGTTPPTVGVKLFEGVGFYTVEVHTMSAVKAYYAASGWRDYASHIGVHAAETKRYYYFNYSSVWELTLGVVIKSENAGATAYGAYEIENDALIAYSASDEEPYFTTKTIGTFDKETRTLLFDLYNYGEADKEYWYSYSEAGADLTLTVESTEDTVTFAPDNQNSSQYIFFQVAGVYKENGEERDVQVTVSRDMYGSTVLYMIDGEYRRSMSVTMSSKTVSLGAPSFIPVVTTYAGEGESYLAVSQNDKEGTAYTVSFILTGIRDADGAPFSAAQVSVEKQAEGTYRTKDSLVFGGYSYRVTFTVENGRFTYALETLRELIVEDGTHRVVLYVSKDNEIAGMTLYVMYYDNWADVKDRTKNYTETHAEGSNVYRWFVYDYNYACDVTLTLTGNGFDIAGSITAARVVKNNTDGVYAILYYRGAQRTALWMRGTDGEYAEIKAADVTERDGYLEVKFKGDVYDLLVGSTDVEIVIAEKTYPSNAEYSDLTGSLLVKRDKSGAVSEAVLTVDGKTYSDFIAFVEDYTNGYFFYTETDSYYVTYGSSDCRITHYQTKTLTAGDASFLCAATGSGRVFVFSATLGGAACETRTTLADGSVIAVLGTTARYFRFGEDGDTVSEIPVQIVEAGDFRLAVSVKDDGSFEVVGAEIRRGDGFVFVTIEYQYDSSGDYNYGIGLTPSELGYEISAEFYFNITVSGGKVTAEYVSSSCY